MREIKFRAWVYDHWKCYYRMVHAPLVYDDECTAEWSQVDLNGALARGGASDYDMEPKSKFMQYTGLRDKNGKEIYEGDVVATCAVLDSEDKFNCVVRYEGGGFVANGSLGVNHHLLEVIGNVHENPELLAKN